MTAKTRREKRIDLLLRKLAALPGNGGAYSKSVAYHEAGHAVAAVCYERPFKHVTIVPELKRGDPETVIVGHVHGLANPPRSLMSCPSQKNSALRQRWCETSIILDLAGPLAERKINPNRKEIDEGMIGDAEAIHIRLPELQRDLHGDPTGECPKASYVTDLHYEWLIGRANYFIDRHWGEIERVAAALEERKTLTEDQVREAMGVRPSWAAVSAHLKIHGTHFSPLPYPKP